MDMYLLKFPYRKVLQPLARKLGWLHPDIVSYFYDSANHPVLLIIAILLILFRMTLNTLDGIMAIQRGNLSLKGEIVNALPDRYSDILMVAGIALSPLCRDCLGIVAISTMFLVSYTGMLGKALTVSWQHHGPMGKVERMVLVMVFALIQFLVLPETQIVQWFGLRATPMEWSMGIMTILGQYTVLRRLKGQLREIKYKEAVEKLDPGRNSGRAIVIYDSVTGNTRKVAEGIAQGLGCSVKSISENDRLDIYEMIVIGTPNIRKRPTAAIQKYQSSITPQSAKLATFATFGLPIWGQITSGTCMGSMAKAWDKKPEARFSCPGYHQKYKTYKSHPNDNDLIDAYLFGVKLSKNLQ
jgi:archaetidylinositol phosphate synthase